MSDNPTGKFETDLQVATRIREGYSKKIAAFQSLILTVVGLSSGLVALPAIVVKFLSTCHSRSVPPNNSIYYCLKSQSDFIKWSMIGGEGMLGLSIFFGLLYIYNSGEYLKGIFDGKTPSSYRYSAGGLSRTAVMDWVFLLSLFLFFIGFLFLTVSIAMFNTA